MTAINSFRLLPMSAFSISSGLLPEKFISARGQRSYPRLEDELATSLEEGTRRVAFFATMSLLATQRREPYRSSTSDVFAEDLE
jgi:hypothetical protein